MGVHYGLHRPQEQLLVSRIESLGKVEEEMKNDHYKLHQLSEALQKAMASASELVFGDRASILVSSGKLEP